MDLNDELDAVERPSADAYSKELNKLLTMPFLSKIRTRASPKPPYLATPIQRSDKRYGRIRQLALEYFSDIGPVDRSVDTIRANLKDTWEIYQTFVTHVVGNALGLTYSSSRNDLRERDNDGTSMRSENIALFFDQHPPRKLLRSWRDDSDRPAGERPDITLINLQSKKSLILDAKFRTDRDGCRATAEDLFEMQAYLNSFGSTQGGILYPGAEPNCRWIRSAPYQIAELPIRAKHVGSLGGIAGIHKYVGAVLSDAIESRI